MIRKRKKIKLLLAIFLILLKLSYDQYRTRTLSKSNQSWILLYRILGNDLPPRHSFNQTITNLLFILQREYSFPNVTKIWILNRIVDPQKEQSLIAILNEYKQIYVRIPFYLNEYIQIPYYFPSNYPTDDYFNSTKFFRLHSLDKYLLIDTIYHKRNLYVMNNNGARNFCLKHGKTTSESQWFMIFDSNCFLPRKAFETISRSLLINGSHVQHFIIPMIRLVNHQNVFKVNQSKSNEEAQIIFRRDSPVEFLENMRYGQAPKQELLQHLGVKKYLWSSIFPQFNPRPILNRSTNANESIFQRTSSIYRLSSYSNPKNEQSAYFRACNRYQGILYFLHNLDFQLTHRQLLPQSLQTNSSKCFQWSSHEIYKFIKAVRQIATNHSNSSI